MTTGAEGQSAARKGIPISPTMSITFKSKLTFVEQKYQLSTKAICLGSSKPLECEEHNNKGVAKIRPVEENLQRQIHHEDAADNFRIIFEHCWSRDKTQGSLVLLKAQLMTHSLECLMLECLMKELAPMSLQRQRCWQTRLQQRLPQFPNHKLHQILRNFLQQLNQ